MKSTQPKRNWIPLPDPIRESEVKLELAWSGDERTAKAIERQAALMGFESPNDYLHQLIAATLAGNEDDSYILEDVSAKTASVSACSARESGVGLRRVKTVWKKSGI